MSVDLMVYLARNRMPDRSRWAKAIHDCGLPVTIDTGFDVDSFSGFLPCSYLGKPGGFEYGASPMLENDRARVGVHPAHDFAVTFTTHSNMHEFATAVVAAAVLCHIAEGTVFDPQAGESVASLHALAWARETLEEISHYLKS